MRSAYACFVSAVLFPLQERIKGHDTVAWRRLLEQSQWWSPERLEAFRMQRLQDLGSRACRHVPYYRQAFADAKLAPMDLRSINDLRQLPLLSKNIIQQRSDEFKNETANRLARFSTGGSTGEPLVFLVGKERFGHDVAAKWRATRWWGVDIGDREVVVWGSPIELGNQDRLREIRDKLFRTRLLPAFDMSKRRLDKFLHEIRRKPPRMLFGYPSALALIAQHAEYRSILLNDIGIRVAFATGERLYDDQRALLKRVFGCAVANGYGGRDAGFVAHECPEGSLHVTAEDVVVEIVNSAGEITSDGDTGEIVITHLATGDFPFIRYRTGDIGSLSKNSCPCGRSLPVLERLDGRSTDFIVKADGTVIHGLALIYVLREQSTVRKFKIRQESVDRVRVFVVPNAGFTASIKELIIEEFQKRLGRETNITVQCIDAIKPESSGKYRYVVSDVRVDSYRKSENVSIERTG